MNFRSLFSKRGNAEQKSGEQITSARPVVVPLQPGSFLEYAFSSNTALPPRRAFEFYRSNSTVATAIDMIADAAAQIRPVVEDSNGKYYYDHPVLSLLRQPNGFETYSEFSGKFFRDYLLTHDIFLTALGRIGGEPLELFVNRPTIVSGMESSVDGYADRYLVYEGAGAGTYSRFRQSPRSFVRYIDGSLRELYHIMGYSSTGSSIQADSPLTAAALEAKQQIKGRIHNLALLENGGRLSLIVSFLDDVPNKHEMLERKEAILSNLSGPENSGGIAVISGKDTKITPVAATNKDMDYAQLDETASRAIYLRYGIPLPLVTLDASTFNNVENSIIYFYESRVLPLFSYIFEGFSKFLMPRFKEDVTKRWITYNPEEIKPLMSKLLNELKVRKDMNIETTNELRALLPGREPLEGGDVLYQNSTQVPVGMDIFTIDNARTPDEVAAEMIRRRQEQEQEGE